MVDQLIGIDFAQPPLTSVDPFFPKPSQNPKTDQIQTTDKTEKVFQKRLVSPRQIGDEFQVNTYITGDQKTPTITALSNRNFLAIWSGRGSGVNYGIFGQVLNSDRSKNGPEFLVSNNTGDRYKLYPDAAPLPNGGFVVTWHSIGDVFKQIFNPDHTKNGSASLANSYTLNDQKEPAIATTNNNTIIVWASHHDGSFSGVFGQLFNADGTKSGSEFQVNTYTPSSQERADVASANNGEFFVVFQSGITNPTIRGHAFNPNGTTKGTESEITSIGYAPKVAALENGRYVVAWHIRSSWDIRARIVNDDGSNYSGIIPVNTVTAGAQQNPAPAGLKDGKFIIAWDDLDIKGMVFDAEGSKISPQFQINSYTTDQQMDPSVTHLGNDRFAVAWSSENQDTCNFGIFAKVFEFSNATTSTSSSASTSTSSTTGIPISKTSTTGATPYTTPCPPDLGFSTSTTSTTSTTTTTISSSSTRSSSSSTISSTSTQSIPGTSLSTSSIPSLATSSLPLGISTNDFQTTTPSSTSLSTKNIQIPPNSDSQHITSLNNSRLITGVALGIIGGLTSLCFLSYLYYRHRRSNRSRSLDSTQTYRATGFELAPVLKRQHVEIGREYQLLKKVDAAEAQDIYQQTGYLIVIPPGKDAVKHVIGKGTFGKILMGQRKADGEYVAVKKVKGEDAMLASEEEAQMQRKAAGDNILPIYNTVRFDNALYHFMPLAALGSGESIQQQLSSLNNPKLGAEILKFVAKDVLTGLKNIHGKGISHLDMKGGNVVFMTGGEGKITDFGCAKELTISPHTLGDKTYFSPQRIASLRGGVFDTQKADMWAVGVMLLVMYKNKSPEELFGLSIDHLHEFTPAMFQEKLEQIEELNSPGEGTIWWVIKGLLDLNEDTRPTAQQALDAACFRGLLPSIKSGLFQKLRAQNLIEHTGSDRQIDMQNYGFVARLQALKEQGETDEIRDLIDRYVPTGHYKLTPDTYGLTPDYV